jgi:hypothetical protein
MVSYINILTFHFTATMSSADVPTPKSNFRQSIPNHKSDPITASAYPTSVNSEAHKSKHNSTGNVHFNINITNIVDSNNKFLQTLNPVFSSDHYAKVFINHHNFFKTPLRRSSLS